MWARDRLVERESCGRQLTPVWRPSANDRGAAVHVRQRIGSERDLESGRASRPRWGQLPSSPSLASLASRVGIGRAALEFAV
jgi:hypothetical protein